MNETNETDAITQPSTEEASSTQAPTSYSFSINNHELSSALRKVSGIVDHSQVIQILGFIKCDLRNKELHLMASNSEIEMHVHIPVITNTLTDGIKASFTLPCKKLLDISRSLAPDAILEVEQKSSWTVIRVGKTQFKLASLDAETFPHMEQFHVDVTLNIPQNRLLWLLRRTSFAMATQDVRFFLNGLLLKVQNQQILTVATDGHRLALNAINDPSADQDGSFIIPKKTIQELCKHLQEDDSNICLKIGKQNISFHSDTLLMYSNLIDGDYPDYSSLIPSQFGHQALVHVDELKSSLSRLIILASEKYHGGKFHFSPESLAIVTNNINQEEARDEVGIDLTGESIAIGFNLHYVIDILQVMQTEKISIGIVDTERSISFTEHESEHYSVFIVMPLSI
mgnify:CR=1 FL=1